MARALARVAPALALLLPAAAAYGHTHLIVPLPRSPSDALKVGPCGGVPAGSQRATLTAGTALAIEWEETIHHPGWFRLALAPHGDQGFDEHVLADNLLCLDSARQSCPPGTDVGQRPSGHYSTTIMVPPQPCEDCTLQLVQVMTDKVPIDGQWQRYFSCADIRIVGAPPGDGATQDDGGRHDTGSPATFDGTATAGDSPSNDDGSVPRDGGDTPTSGSSGGCAIGRRGAGPGRSWPWSPSWLALGGLALGRRRRRRLPCPGRGTLRPSRDRRRPAPRSALPSPDAHCERCHGTERVRSTDRRV